ncbi:MAG: glycosyltransferase [Candidatus Fermentithermobacillus carboniphilus]|uniref:Glycosyltransferase n=1 Tax=Candidatus Fermentithermobacillus carboniphilus TaxID=3085328 RepID=A0AAT9LF36_9FIRM|nr:MAG: glycosyltransferase [Candidatus Fermentithermobacillus carboniphilus]
MSEDRRTQDDMVIAALIEEGCASVTKLAPSPEGPVQAVDRIPRTQSDLIRMVDLAMLAGQGSVFTVGCGFGDLPVILSAFGLEVFGVDPDPLSIDVTRYRFYTLGLTCGHFRLGDLVIHPDPDNCFDSVVLVDVLDRVPDPSSVLQEAQRLVKPGGRILVSIPDSYWVTRPEKISIFTKQTFLKLLRENLNGTVTLLDSEGWLSAVVVVDKLGETNCPDVSLYLKPFYVPCHGNPLVSIIVPTYNRASLLLRSLTSLFNQTYKNIEIIVVNDGSTDSTEEVVAPYLDRIKYLKQPNRGSPSAMNAGIKEARGKYVWVFADDDVALPRKLEVQVPLMEASGAGLIHSAAISVNENFEVIHVWVPAEFSPDSIMEAELLGNRFFTPTVLVPKKVIQDVGMYDERLIRAQDYDYWIRIVHRYPVIAADYLCAFYFQHTGARGSSFDSFDVSNVAKKTLEYERIIFDKVYQSIPLSAAFPSVSKYGSPVVEAEALLVRAVVVAKRGLLNYAVTDIERAANLMKSNPFTLSIKARECVRMLGDILGNCEDKVVARSGLIGLRDILAKSREQLTLDSCCL